MTDKLNRYTDLTLADALEAFRADEGLSAHYVGMRPQAKLHFDRHDVIHVLFGLDTTMSDEAAADGWTLFATDIRWADIRAFEALPEEQELIRQIGIPRVALGYLRAIPDYFRIAWRSRRMARRWPWRGLDNHAGRTVGEVRRDFGIDAALLG